eukprot:TRINITY_DN74404_c0_g1_i1.p1 TRINITY_DN74404_c0_g1~~TRINITY_DN74404_c0_g1_i1.p1  ORF type:complete len:395 (+),score=52.06 TRINITY_DN74404_c0_g1_i1:61-1245(+)
MAAVCELSFFSRIKLRHKLTSCCLHSHSIDYPGGSRRQQVTCYDKENADDYWIVKPASQFDADYAKPTLVAHGATIRLEHHVTQQTLRSHDAPAHVVHDQYEVFCARNDGDEHDSELFRIDMFPGNEVKLIHIKTDRALHSHRECYKFFPKQQEVTCFPHRDDNDIWVIHEVNAPGTWKPSVLGLPPRNLEEMLGADSKAAPFSLVWCECQGAFVLAVKCNDEKHSLAQDAAALVEKIISPGCLRKIGDGGFGHDGSSQWLFQDVRSVQGGPFDGQCAIGLGTNQKKRMKGAVIAHVVAALLARNGALSWKEERSRTDLNGLLTVARQKKPAPHVRSVRRSRDDRAVTQTSQIDRSRTPHIKGDKDEVPSMEKENLQNASAHHLVTLKFIVRQS